MACGTLRLSGPSTPAQSPASTKWRNLLSEERRAPCRPLNAPLPPPLAPIPAAARWGTTARRCAQTSHRRTFFGHAAKSCLPIPTPLPLLTLPLSTKPSPCLLVPPCLVLHAPFSLFSTFSALSCPILPCPASQHPNLPAALFPSLPLSTLLHTFLPYIYLFLQLPLTNLSLTCPPPPPPLHTYHSFFFYSTLHFPSTLLTILEHATTV